MTTRSITTANQTTLYNNSFTFAMKPNQTEAVQKSLDWNIFASWNNPDNIISLETYTLISNILVCYFNPLIFCVGVPTNILNCVVFIKQGLGDRMNLCLFSLALVDLLFVVLHCLSGFHCWVGFIRPELENWWKWSARRYTIGLYQGFLLCSGCITMIISVERCVCVFLPLKASTLVKTRTMGLVILATVVSIQLMCVIYPLQMDVVLTTDPVNNASDFGLSPSALFVRHQVLFEIIQNIFSNTVIPFFAFVVVLISTVVTVIQLKRTIAWREGSSSGARQLSAATSRQMALVKTLVIVSCIFICTSSPIVALSIATVVEPEFFVNRRYNNLFQATYSLYATLCLVNSSINFFVYLYRSSRFRKELGTLLAFRSLYKDDLKEEMTKTITDSCGLDE